MLFRADVHWELYSAKELLKLFYIALLRDMEVEGRKVPISNLPTVLSQHRVEVSWFCTKNGGRPVPCNLWGVSMLICGSLLEMTPAPALG